MRHQLPSHRFGCGLTPERPREGPSRTVSGVVEPPTFAPWIPGHPGVADEAPMVLWPSPRGPGPSRVASSIDRVRLRSTAARLVGWVAPSMPVVWTGPVAAMNWKESPQCLGFADCGVPVGGLPLMSRCRLWVLSTNTFTSDSVIRTQSADSRRPHAESQETKKRRGHGIIG